MFSAYVIASFLALCTVLVLTMLVSTFFNHEYDSTSPIVLSVLGALGLLSIFSLNKSAVRN